MQVAAAELRCTASTHQYTQLQRVSEERLQQLQSAEAAAGDASSRAAAAVATTGDLQRQLSGVLRQRDDLSRLVTERHAPVTALTVCIHDKPCRTHCFLLHALLTLQSTKSSRKCEGQVQAAVLYFSKLLDAMAPCSLSCSVAAVRSHFCEHGCMSVLHLPAST